MGTKNNPGEYDCYEKADPDEPIFVLLGRDRFAASLVRLWAHAKQAVNEEILASRGWVKNKKVVEARDCADAMAGWCDSLDKGWLDVLAFIPWEILAEELRRRGATVTPVPHGGDDEKRN